MEELIKKSDAIKALNTEAKEQFRLDDSYAYVIGTLRNVEDAISNIPSADRWIPCSERLPDEDTEVLVVDYNEAMQVCSVTSYEGMPVWEDAYGYWHGIEVFDAWMPLPEPWKGADDESKNHH